MSNILPSVYDLIICRQFCTLQTATLNQMMKISLQKGKLDDAVNLLQRNPMSRNVVSWNIALSGCIKDSEMKLAHHLFDEMPERDIVSWNTWLSLLHKIKDPQGTCESYLQLQISGPRPNNYTFSIVVTSILGSIFNVLIPQLHAQVVTLGYNSSEFVGTALMRGYTNLGDHAALGCVFEDVLEKCVSLWNALILGYMDLGLAQEAQRTFNKMPEKNVVSWTTMVDGYLKNKQINKARYVFDKMDQKNVVSWTVMISGYVRVENYSDALRLYLLMARSGIQANQHTFASILAACAGQSELLTGKQVHASIINLGIPMDVVLSTALIDMYAKCGDIEAACCIFEMTPNKTLASWNSIIGGCARHGLARRALDEFEKMNSSDLRPDHVTFVNILSACAHRGLIDEGERLFGCMETVYEISPEKEHYACMVDLYGRAGHIDKAARLIECMPFEPDVVVWDALLGACGLHLDPEFSNDAADAILNLEKDHPAAYSMLSKILGEKGVWSSLVELKIMMKDKLITKQKAGSWIS